MPKVDFLAREINDEVACVYAENQKTDFEVQNGGSLIIDLNSISHAKRLAQTLFLVVSQSHAILLLYKRGERDEPKTHLRMRVNAYWLTTLSFGA